MTINTFRVLMVFLFIAMPVAKGEQKMARLIFEETWSDGNWASRGFHRAQPGYKLEYDATLDRQVMYNEWTTSHGSAMPVGVSNGLMKRVDPDIINNGGTIYSLFKSENYITVYGGAGRRRSHLGPKLNTRVYSAGNADGEIGVDYQLLKSYFGAGINPTNTLGHNSYSHPGTPLTNGQAWVDTQWAVQSDRAGAEYTWGDWGQNGSHRGVMKDDVWYEIALYIKTDNGRENKNQSIHLYFREYGTSNWHTAFAYDNTNVTNVPSTGDACVGFGTYLHDRANGLSADVRFYSGGIWFYEGNAVADGTLGAAPTGDVVGGGDTGGGTGGDTGGTPGGGTDVALEVTNFKVSQVGSNAVNISWTTNNPANGVVDYGSTDAMGTIVRDNDLTTDHLFQLTDLDLGTYHYRYSSKDANGSAVFDPTIKTFVVAETVVEEPEPATPADVLPKEAKEGDVLMFSGGKWIAVSLHAAVDSILQGATIDIG